MPVEVVSIRNATAADAAVLDGLIRQLAAHEGAANLISFSQEQLAAALADDPPRLRAILAEDAGSVLGFITYTIDFAIWTGGNVIHVDDVFVSDGARKRGIGRRMMTRIAELAVAGQMNACWEIEPANINAQHFYRGLGVATRDKIIARWDLPAMSALLADVKGTSLND